VNCNIRKVKTSENTQIHSDPKSLSNSAPATEAPIVWAAVFKMRMLAIGRSMFVLKCCHKEPILRRLAEIEAIWLGLRLNSVASINEQKAEIASAPETLRMSNHMVEKSPGNGNFAKTWISHAIRDIVPPFAHPPGKKEGAKAKRFVSLASELRFSCSDAVRGHDRGHELSKMA